VRERGAAEEGTPAPAQAGWGVQAGGAKELNGARSVSNQQWEQDNGAALVTEEERREVAAATKEASESAAVAAAALSAERTLSLERGAKVLTPLQSPHCVRGEVCVGETDSGAGAESVG
jgi:hypothetical protein